MIGVRRLKLFIDRLVEKVEQKNSRVCVGLDPHLGLIPSFLYKECRLKTNSDELALPTAITVFNKIIIDHIYDIAVAVKPQMAFYELLGIRGRMVLQDTISYAHEKGLIVILDGKRNDIGSTASAYAAAYLTGRQVNPFQLEESGQEDPGNDDGLSKDVSGKNDALGNEDGKDDGLSKEDELRKKVELRQEEMNAVVGDALTVNPYLGFDGIKPFLKNMDKGAFSLVRTSNKSAGDIQDLKLANGSRLYQQVGNIIEDWGKEYRGQSGYSNLGAVVGATYPEELKYLRESMPHTYFLIPGYGAQGGTANDIIYGFDKNNQGALINSSRGIIFAYSRDFWKDKYSEVGFGEAARMAAKKMKENINHILENRK